MKTRLLSAPGGVALLMLLCAALGAAARAQDADPPARAARLSDTEGAVSLQPAGTQDWTAATLNRPLTTGDKVWSDQGSRAELDLGGAVIRLGSTTGVSFLNLADASTQMQLSAGTLIVRVRDMQPSESYEIDTPNLALSLQQPGDYRVQVNDAGDTTVVKVSEGTALALAGAQTIAISAQQSVTFTGTQTLAYYSATLGAPDALDNWSAARDLQADDSVSSQYVAADIPGTQDLDNNGRWQDTPDYGYVWMPTAVVVAWVPYRFGHWAWITPWGWTWVDDAPWGYAPFHYGRWVQWNNAWAWVPGPRRGRAVYAPALVGWVGGPTPGTPAAFGSSVGWFPLGPREVYVPAARVSPLYLRNVNITNTTVVNTALITNIYQNSVTPTHYVNNRPAAVTAVPQNIFSSGQPVGGHAVHLPPAVLAGAAVTAAAPAIAPIRQSVLGPSEGRGAVRPPAALLQRPVVARTPPPRALASFDGQLAAIQANGGRPLNPAQMASLQPATPAMPVRVVASRGPVIAASALPQRGGTMRPGTAAMPGGSGPPAQVAAPSAASLAERERALQQNSLPPSPHANSARAPPARSNADLPTYAPPPPAAESSFAPQGRNDRLPAAQPYQPPPAQPYQPPQEQPYQPPPAQRPVNAVDPSPAYNHPAALPVYHPPVGPDPGTPAQESARAQGGVRAPPPAAAPRTSVPTATQPVARPPPPAPVPPPRDPRDAARHADPDSRERTPR